MNLAVAAALSKANLVKLANYVYTSGKSGPVYVDMRELFSYPVIFKFITKQLVVKAKTLKFDIIAGNETVGLPIATAMSLSLNKPMIYVRKKVKGYGRNLLVEGIVKPGQKVLLIDDLITYGTSKVKFIKALEDVGAVVKDVMIILERGEKNGGRQVLEKKDYRLHTLITLTELMEYMVKRGLLSADKQQRILKYLDNPQQWQKNNNYMSSKKRLCKTLIQPKKLLNYYWKLKQSRCGLKNRLSIHLGY